MSSIVVFRYAGDKKGTDIVDALLSCTAAKVERGRVELDQHALPIQTVTMTIVFRAGLRLGQVIEVHDSAQGVSWRGKITGILHKVTDATYTTDLTIHRPTGGF